MKDFYSIKINIKGGIISSGTLKKIVEFATSTGIEKVRFGLRQQMYLYIPRGLSYDIFEKLTDLGVDFEVNKNNYPNIVSSYCAEEVFQKGNWLTEGIYKDILDLFDYQPQVKINISDGQQSFTPFFSGHLNFISSKIPNFWFLTIRLPKTNEVHAYNKLIFSNEIAKISKVLEQEILENNGKDNTPFYLWSKIPSIISLEVEESLELPKFTLPYYEGFNRYDKKTWLGIYRRDELFDVDFLLKMCEVAAATNINEICVTSWKSLIIKGIDEVGRADWSKLLTKFNINVRHAANELNWQIEDDSEDALLLKTMLAEAFNNIDLRTFGICFGIKTIPKTEVFASIMVRRRRFKLLNFIPFNYVYDISYTEDFDPNGRTKIYFEEGILKVNLVEQLRRSVLFYNKKQTENSITKLEKQVTHEILEVEKKKNVHQCEHCFTVYDEEFGDLLNNIPVGTPFEKLPETYKCSTCEAPKSDFVVVQDMLTGI